MFSIKRFNTRLFAAIVSVVVLFVTVFSLSSSNANAEDIIRTYKVYNATTGTYLRQYDLTVEGNNVRSVIGNDDRKVDYSENGVVKIIKKDGTRCSGFVVSDHVIATAAHCLKNKKIDSILFFDKNKKNCMTITDPVEYHLPDKYVQNSNLIAYDYALITVEQSLEDYECFDFGMMTEKFLDNSDNVVSVTGFPGEVGGVHENTDTTHVMYKGKGNVVNKEYGDSGYIERIYYTADSTGGNSGGPIYYEEEFEGRPYCTVIGIHAYSDGETPARQNSGTAMSPQLLKFLKCNPNLNY